MKVLGLVTISKKKNSVRILGETIWFEKNRESFCKYRVFRANCFSLHQPIKHDWSEQKLVWIEGIYSIQVEICYIYFYIAIMLEVADQARHFRFGLGGAAAPKFQKTVEWKKNRAADAKFFEHFRQKLSLNPP